MAGAGLGAPPARFAWQTAALGAPPASFAWQAQHLRHLHRSPPATTEDFGRRFVVCGRRSTWSTSGSFGVAGAALEAPS